MIEIGNSGVFRPEMIRPMGLPENVNVLGWGAGLERPTMILYGYNITELFGYKIDLKMVKKILSQLYIEKIIIFKLFK